jgi:hypothetical protein
MFYRYGFESQVYPQMSRIPLHVRMKLDLVGIRLTLKGWLALSFEERMVVCHLPAESAEEKDAFTAYLDFLALRYSGEKFERVAALQEPPWEQLERVPEAVAMKSQEAERPIAREEWSRCDRYQRYALYKLAVSRSEPELFFVALREFREGHRGSS